MSAPETGLAQGFVKAGEATRWKAGQTGNPGGLTKAERAWRRALEERHIPRASGLLDTIYDAAVAAYAAGDLLAGERNAALFFKICGLIRKPNDDANVQELAKQLLDGMLEEARARREATEPEGK